MATDREGRELVSTRERIANKRKDARAATTMAEVMKRVQQSDSKELLVVIKTTPFAPLDP